MKEISYRITKTASDEYIIVHQIGKSPKKIDRLESSERYQQALIEIEHGNLEKLVELASIKDSIAEMKTKHLSIRNNSVYYDNEVLPEVLNKKLLHLYESGLTSEIPVFERFVERIMLNSSRRAREELYSFLEACELPILEDGRFLAYKGVNNDYTDKHTGKISNKIGEKPAMPRRDVDDNQQNTCSYGFHVGSHRYADGFAGIDGCLMFVAICPSTVVSIPVDENCEKCRVCEYEVIGEDVERIELKKAVYTKDNDTNDYIFNDDDMIDDDDNDDAMDDQLNRSIIRCSIEFYLAQGKHPTVDDIMTAARIDDDITDLIEDLGYKIDNDDHIYPDFGA